MHNETIYILWNNSCLWGLMALRAIRAFGIACRLVKSYEITQGLLLGKPCEKALLLVPGGSARLKAQSLGMSGRNAIRGWLWQGGQYLGFCGGAGFALRSEKYCEGLSICPWSRAVYAERHYHLLSGNVLASVASYDQPLKLPVWWPGRFEEKHAPGLNILARYFSPDHDLYLGDLPILTCRDDDSVNMETAGFPFAEPLVISGRYGQGSYLLSYAHLETPESAAANKWLAELLRDQFGFTVNNTAVQEWQTMSNKSWVDNTGIITEITNFRDMQRFMSHAHAAMSALMHRGLEKGMFFKRLPWLTGWESGAPGIVCNHLLAGLAWLAQNPLSRETLSFWQGTSKLFSALYREFILNAIKFIDNWPNSHNQHEIFGHPMRGGGIIQKLLDMVYEFIYLSA